MGEYEKSFPYFQKALSNEKCNKDVEVDFFIPWRFRKNIKKHGNITKQDTVVILL